MVELIKTGVEGLDDAVGGGFPDKSIILILGQTGSNYDTFTHQIIYNHIAQGGKVAYYLVENTPSDIQDEMLTYKWDIAPAIKEGLWVFVSVQTPDIQRLSEVAPLAATEQKVPLSTSVNSLKKDFLARAKEGRWTALQLSHLLHQYDYKEVIDLFLYLRLVVRTHGGLHFLLLPQAIHPESVTNALMHLSDGVMEFQIRERGREYEGVMLLKKMRLTTHRTKNIPFIISERGVSVEMAERII